jgi:hypothetical protein
MTRSRPISLSLILICLTVVSCRNAALLEVSRGSIPFTKRLVLQKGDAYRLKLPDGHEIAFWCITQDFPIGEQTTRSGLDMMWGERPFKTSPVVYERDRTTAESPTYITFEGVLTTGSSTSASRFKIGAWRVTLTEDISSTSGLPVTIQVE